MRLLLFAYEFPPVVSAQALRWYYLANELARLGVEIDVLAPRLRDVWGFEPELHASVRVHRCFPGPYVGLSGWLAGDRQRGGADRAGEPRGRRFDRALERAYRFVRKLLDNVMFPDVRTEWLPFAWYRASRLHRQRSYELIISSHEPGVDLLLGLVASYRWEVPWIADLADPVSAPYTPKWRRPLDGRFERWVCESADDILVTTEGTKRLLMQRHDLPGGDISLIRQGFDSRPRRDVVSLDESIPADRFVIVFTGNFYREFRDPAPLIAALRELTGMVLVIAGGMDDLESRFRTLGDRVQLLGRRPHEECLALQHRADLLVNLGNVQSYQVPGKIYEYLGAGRPILHVSSCDDDAIAELLATTRRGRAVHNDGQAIREALETMYAQWREGALDKHFDLGATAVADYSWASQAQKLYHKIEARL